LSSQRRSVSGSTGCICHGLGCRSFLACRSDHHDHLAAFKAWELLDQNGIGKIITNAVEQGQAQLLVRNFTTTEPQCDFALVTIRQKTADIAHLDVVVAIVRTRTKLDFLDLDDCLLGLGFCSTFLLKVFELTVVHQTAYRWNG